MKRKIGVVTGSRAEYGLLQPLLKEIDNDRDLKLELLVTGMHLSEYFGLTYREIVKDGFAIGAKIDIGLNSDTPAAISKSIALAVSGFAKAYQRLKPDIVVLLGDRFEIFAAAVAAHVSRIPIGHIQGGELTEGAIDDAFRHSITKMSQLHFASTEIYRRRIIQLGESPGRVFNVGALGLDSVKSLKLLSKKALERELNLKLNKHNLLVTFHPVTLEENSSKWQFKALLEVLDELDDTNIIFTKANADAGGRIINKMIAGYVSTRPDEAAAFASLGQLRYLSAMRFVDAVVGNSSSGIIEAPSFKIGTIDIGDRQKGRIKAKSVIECRPTKEGIRRAFKRLYSPQFQNRLGGVTNPYGDGNASRRIRGILKNYDMRNIIKKAFYDIDFKLG